MDNLRRVRIEYDAHCGGYPIVVYHGALLLCSCHRVGLHPASNPQPIRVASWWDVRQIDRDLKGRLEHIPTTHNAARACHKYCRGTSSFSLCTETSTIEG